MAVGAVGTGPVNHAGFNKLARAQVEQARVAQREGPTESVAMSRRAQLEAVYDRTNQGWKELRIPESQPLSPSEQRVMNNVSFMGNTARKDGGGFKQVRGEHETIVDNKAAFQALRNGGQVNFYESGGEQPVALRSYSQVNEVARDLRERIAETQAAARR